MVTDYSLRKDGNKALSANFKVKEFACRDGSDTVKIDDKLIAILQKVRDHFKKPVTVVSGYRSPSYNKSIKGATKSQHMLGKAADIQIAGVKPRAIAEYLEAQNAKGLGLYEYGGMNGFVHVDTRDNRSRWVQYSPNGGAQATQGFYTTDTNKKPTVKLNSRGEAVKDLQKALNNAGYPCGVADGIFGAKTEKAVKDFQKHNGLVADGIVGAKTWAKLGV